MVSIDGSVLEEWIMEHKNLMMILILIGGIFSVICIVLHDPLRRYLFCLHRIESLTEQIGRSKRHILDQLILGYELKSKMDFFESSEISVGELKSTAGWLSDYLGVCGIFHYAFSEETKVPLGGQGWPIFSVLMEVCYPQVSCVLYQFSQHSVDWHLNELTLSREGHQSQLKMKMDVSIIR